MEVTRGKLRIVVAQENLHVFYSYVQSRSRTQRNIKEKLTVNWSALRRLSVMRYTTINEILYSVSVSVLSYRLSVIGVEKRQTDRQTHIQTDESVHV